MMSDCAHWDERYEQNDTPWETGHASTELVRVIAEEKIAPGRAIELGCGSGGNAVWLAQQGFEVTGVDLSPIASQRASARAAAAGVHVRFLAADVLHLPELGAFDFFFDRGCYHVLHREGQGAAYVAAIARLTTPGSRGLVLAGNAREKHEPGPPVVTEQELRGDWETHFEVVSLREFRFDQAMLDVAFQPLGWAAVLRRRA